MKTLQVREEGSTGVVEMTDLPSSSLSFFPLSFIFFLSF